MSHYLYLVRHGEQQDAEHGLPDGPLSPRGVRQARAARRTARRRAVRRRLALAAAARRTRRRRSSTADAGARSPSRPRCCSTASRRARRPRRPQAFEPFFGSVTEAEIEAGQRADGGCRRGVPRSHARGPPRPADHPQLRDRLVRARGVRAPDWRWLALNQANCGLTVIRRSRGGRGRLLVTHNDLGAPAARAAHRPARAVRPLTRACGAPRRARSADALPVPVRRVRVVVVGLDLDVPARR